MDTITFLAKPNSIQTRKEFEFDEFDDSNSDAIFYQEEYYVDMADIQLGGRFTIKSEFESARALYEDEENYDIDILS